MAKFLQVSKKMSGTPLKNPIAFHLDCGNNETIWQENYLILQSMFGVYTSTHRLSVDVLMSNNIWHKYPILNNLHCVDMKDRAQKKVLRETCNISSDEIVEYYKRASIKFRKATGFTYTKCSRHPETVRETRRAKRSTTRDFS